VRSIAKSVVRFAALGIVVAACLAAPASALAQSDERKPPPAAKETAKKDDKAGAAKQAERAQPRARPRGDERIKLDAPVSFPVDI